MHPILLVAKATVNCEVSSTSVITALNVAQLNISNGAMTPKAYNVTKNTVPKLRFPDLQNENYATDHVHKTTPSFTATHTDPCCNFLYALKKIGELCGMCTVNFGCGQTAVTLGSV